MEFRYSCVECNNDRFDELMHVINNARTITYETFRKHIGGEEIHRINMRHGYDRCSPSLNHIKKDRCVEFCRSRLPNGRPVYFYQWSRIEFVYY